MRNIFIIFLLLAARALGATYYIDFATGSDANNGTAKATPWKHHPYMQGRTGVTYTHANGDQFIFKGGVTWDHTCFAMDLSTGGASGNSDYYGVDLTWYTGGSWTRPIFDGENVTVASGADAGIIHLTANNVTIDNIELTGFLVSGNTYGVGTIWGYNGTAANILIQNCYVHNWKAGAGVTADDARGGIVFTFPQMSNVVIDSCTFSNSENSSKQNGMAIRCVTEVKNCTIHDVSTSIVYAGEIHDNLIYNVNLTGNKTFDASYHTNIMYTALWKGTSTALSRSDAAHIYNNVIHDIDAGTQIYCEPCFGNNDASIYVYNNVLWNNNAGGDACISADPEQGSGAKGAVYVYNNTIVIAAGTAIQASINHTGTNNIAVMQVFNNHIITSGTAINCGTVTTLTTGNNLTQTAATASGQGYVSGNEFAPTSTSAGTYNAGTPDSVTGSTTDILGVSRPQATTWDIGAYEYVAGGSAPTAPTSPSATALSSSSISVAWTDASSDETGFEVERSADGSTGWTNRTTTAANATSYSDTGLSASTQYFYRVRAVNGSGNSSYTSNVNATTSASSPAAPDNYRKTRILGSGF